MTKRSIFTLIVIAILATILSACSGDLGADAVNLIVSANADGTKPASELRVLASPRIAKCGISEKAQIKGGIEADLAAAGESVSELDVTTDDWLDSWMSTFGCIAERPDEATATPQEGE